MVDNKSTHVKTQESQENKVMEGSETLTTPQDNDIVTLTHSIIEWRRLKEESDSYRQQLKERSKKMKVLEEVILRVMKSNNIGALDLKSSGGRV